MAYKLPFFGLVSGVIRFARFYLDQASESVLVGICPTFINVLMVPKHKPLPRTFDIFLSHHLTVLSSMSQADHESINIQSAPEHTISTLPLTHIIVFLSF